MNFAVFCESAFVVRTVPWRAVANTRLIGFEVCRWPQCSDGKSKSASTASVSLVRQVTALGYLMLRAWKRSVQLVPNTNSTVANGDLWRGRQVTQFDFGDELVPALRTFPQSNLKVDQFLFTFRGRADNHHNAFGFFLHSGLKVDAICPYVDVMTSGHITSRPSIILPLPARR